MLLDTDLREVGHQIAQPGFVMRRQAVTDDDNQIEVLIRLFTQTGQGDRLKQAEPLFQPGLGVEKRDTFLDAVVFHLKAADGRV